MPSIATLFVGRSLSPTTTFGPRYAVARIGLAVDSLGVYNRQLPVLDLGIIGLQSGSHSLVYMTVW